MAAKSPGTCARAPSRLLGPSFREVDTGSAQECPLGRSSCSCHRYRALAKASAQAVAPGKGSGGQATHLGTHQSRTARSGGATCSDSSFAHSEGGHCASPAGGLPRGSGSYADIVRLHPVVVQPPRLSAAACPTYKEANRRGRGSSRLSDLLKPWHFDLLEQASHRAAPWAAPPPKNSFRR